MRILDRGTSAIQNILGTVVFSIGPQLIDIVTGSVTIGLVLQPAIAVIVRLSMFSTCLCTCKQSCVCLACCICCLSHRRLVCTQVFISLGAYIPVNLSAYSAALSVSVCRAALCSLCALQ